MPCEGSRATRAVHFASEGSAAPPRDPGHFVQHLVEHLVSHFVQPAATPSWPPPDRDRSPVAAPSPSAHSPDGSRGIPATYSGFTCCGRETVRAPTEFPPDREPSLARSTLAKATPSRRSPGHSRNAFRFYMLRRGRGEPSLARSAPCRTRRKEWFPAHPEPPE